MNSLINGFAAYQDVEFTADWCIKCNICTAACPVAPVTDLFPGPKTVGPQAQRFRRDDDRGPISPDKSVDYCSGCGTCTLVCPHGVKVMEMNARAREQLYGGRIPLRTGCSAATKRSASSATSSRRWSISELISGQRESPLRP